MNYIEQIKAFWILDKEHSFNGNESRLYFYLLNLSHSLYWKNPLTNADGYTAALVGISVNTLKTCRNRLQQAGLIKFKSGGNGARNKSVYEIIEAKNIIGKVSKFDTLSAKSLTPYLTPNLENLNTNNKHKLNSTPPHSPPMDFSVGSSCLKVEPSCSPTEKEGKEKSCVKKEKIELPFSSERFAKAWEEWKEYKAKEHGFRYKSTISEKTALTQLKNKSQNKEPLALAIIEQSIANGWEGMFALKAEDLNKQKHLYDLPPKDSHIRKLG